MPSNFDGIPVLNNLKATFYGFKDDRKANDIDNPVSYTHLNDSKLKFHGTAEKYQNSYRFKELLDKCYEKNWVTYCKDCILYTSIRCKIPGDQAVYG